MQVDGVSEQLGVVGGDGGGGADGYVIDAVDVMMLGDGSMGT